MKFILVAFLSFFYISHLRADLGGCVVYKAKYVLKNGQTVTGWLPISGYEDYASFDEGKQTNKYCGDLAFQTARHVEIGKICKPIRKPKP
jgi:hypothetical protein